MIEISPAAEAAAVSTYRGLTRRVMNNSISANVATSVPAAAGAGEPADKPSEICHKSLWTSTYTEIEPNVKCCRYVKCHMLLVTVA